MDTRQLAAFCAVVERRSFSLAAERLGVTQPAVSLQIQGLEKRLGTKLLDRSGRRVEPTEAGMRLYRGAQRLLALEEQVVAEVAEEYRDRGVALYCLNQREDPDTIRAFLEEKKFDVHVSLDAKSEAGRAYGVRGIPTLVVIDKAGLVQSVHVGFNPDIGRQLKKELDALLAGKDLADVAVY